MSLRARYSTIHGAWIVPNPYCPTLLLARGATKRAAERLAHHRVNRGKVGL